MAKKPTYEELEQRVKELENLKRQADEFKDLYNNSPCGYHSLDQNGMFVRINRTELSWLGYSEDEIVGNKKFTDVITKESRKVFQKNFPGFKERGYVKDLEFDMVRKDGSILPVMLNATAIKDTAGNYLMSRSTITDLTERKRTEEALQESEAFLNATGQIAKVGGWTIDGETKKVFWTKEIYNITEVPNDYDPSSLEKAAIAFFSAADQLILDKAIQRAFEHNEPYDMEFQITTAKGNRKWTRAICKPIVVDGKVVRLSGTFQDITDRKSAETELTQARKLEAVGQLAAGIAHEINTPTQFVGDNVTFLQDALKQILELQGKQGLLLEAAKTGTVSYEVVEAVEAAVKEADVEYLTEEIPKAVEQSLEGVDRISKIVRAMKEFSHPGVTGMTGSDINEAIETTITVARNEWKYLAEIETELDPSLPLVPCLVSEFNQVILNLIINAAHAIRDVVGDGSNEKGTIRVSTRRDGDWAEIRVSDTGLGISQEIRERIFEPFFTTKDVGKGSGQGLAMARSVIEKKHHGMLTFETEMEKGTTFNIRLPIRDVPRKEEAPTSIEEFLGNGKTILVVDDVHEQREIATMLLTKLGYSVNAVSSGEEAVEYVKTNSTDLLVLDMAMDPGMDGLDTYKKIRELHPGMKAIIASGFSETPRVEQAQKLGAGQYIKKPYTLEKIGLAVKAELER